MTLMIYITSATDLARGKTLIGKVVRADTYHAEGHDDTLNVPLIGEWTPGVNLGVKCIEEMN